MSFTLLVLTDGRGECLARTLASAEVALGPVFDRRLIVNDCPGREYQHWLLNQYGHAFEVIGPGRQRRGFGGAISAGWDAVGPGDGFVFHLEDDFVFNRPVELGLMRALLDRYVSLAQVALLRQPWNDEERAAGGVMAVHPEAFTDRYDDRIGDWVEHRRFFTTNPCLYPRHLLQRRWPTGAFSEGKFTHQLLEAGMSFAYWGKTTDAPWVHHVGEERVGVGY